MVEAMRTDAGEGASSRDKHVIRLNLVHDRLPFRNHPTFVCQSDGPV